MVPPSSSAASPAGDVNPDSPLRFEPYTLPDLICLSHLRWNFVFQRPQHLMTRCARARRVFFVEEPIVDAALADDDMDVTVIARSLYVLTPMLAADGRLGDQDARVRRVLDETLAKLSLRRFVLWYWTPMALTFTRHLEAELVVFDCMDDLSGFAGAPAGLAALERELMTRADVVFTGGHSLYEAKATSHHNIHAIPSSVDVPHFRTARAIRNEPPDQSPLPRPRLGFFGVVDERMDMDLVAAIARLRPDWQLVLIGPTAKIDSAQLPRGENIHYLGMKSYEELPAYLAGWDVALLPFACNAATRFISPTKTPEYLAAGCPVVSTPIRDVVRPYGERGLVQIADSAEQFVAAASHAMVEDRLARLERADAFLANVSWDATWAHMSVLMTEAHTRRRRRLSPVMPVAPSATTPGAAAVAGIRP